jgi:hypothetical protein
MDADLDDATFVAAVAGRLDDTALSWLSTAVERLPSGRCESRVECAEHLTDDLVATRPGSGSPPSTSATFARVVVAGRLLPVLTESADVEDGDPTSGGRDEVTGTQ